MESNTSGLKIILDMKPKESIFMLIVFCFSAITIFSRYQTPDQNAGTGNNKIASEFHANSDYTSDIVNYKNEVSKIIDTNNQKLAEFNVRIKADNEDVKAVFYKTKLLNLEDRNSGLKKRIGAYKAKGKVQWVSFKKEFSHDIDKLGKALNDLMK